MLSPIDALLATMIEYESPDVQREVYRNIFRIMGKSMPAFGRPARAAWSATTWASPSGSPRQEPPPAAYRVPGNLATAGSSNCAECSAST